MRARTAKKYIGTKVILKHSEKTCSITNETNFNETNFISALKNIQNFPHIMTEHKKKTLISNRKKNKL